MEETTLSYQETLNELKYVNAIANNLLVSVDLAAKELIPLLFSKNEYDTAYSLSNKHFPKEFVAGIDAESFYQYLIFAVAMQMSNCDPAFFIAKGEPIPSMALCNEAYKDLKKNDPSKVKTLVKSLMIKALDLIRAEKLQDY